MTAVSAYVQGLFSRMTFRRELFLGGFKNVSKPAPKTGATSGFVGCVRRLRINNKDYDMRKGSFVGDTLYGINVGQFQSLSGQCLPLCRIPQSVNSDLLRLHDP